MHYTYILKLNKGRDKKKFYIGCSSDLRRRLCEHQEDKVFSTKERNSELIYYESYASIELARKKENSLKKFGSAYVGLLKRIGEK